VLAALEQMFRFSVVVMFSLHFGAAVASLTPKEVVVLALGANPASIREREVGITRHSSACAFFLIGASGLFGGLQAGGGARDARTSDCRSTWLLR